MKDESDRVKTTLDSWGGTVADFQSKIADELEKAKQAKATIHQQDQAIRQAHNDTGEADRESNRVTIDSARRKKAQAQSELNACKRRAASLASEYDRADNACNARLQGAVPTALAGIAGFAGLSKTWRSFGSRGIKLYKGAKVYKELKGKRSSVVSLVWVRSVVLTMMSRWAMTRCMRRIRVSIRRLVRGMPRSLKRERM